MNQLLLLLFFFFFFFRRCKYQLELLHIYTRNKYGKNKTKNKKQRTDCGFQGFINIQCSCIMILSSPLEGLNSGRTLASNSKIMLVDHDRISPQVLHIATVALCLSLRSYYLLERQLWPDQLNCSLIKFLGTKLQHLCVAISLC